VVKYFIEQILLGSMYTASPPTFERENDSKYYVFQVPGEEKSVCMNQRGEDFFEKLPLGKVRGLFQNENFLLGPPPHV
jgi:hypothetical protein